MLSALSKLGWILSQKIKVCNTHLAFKPTATFFKPEMGNEVRPCPFSVLGTLLLHHHHHPPPAPAQNMTGWDTSLDSPLLQLQGKGLALEPLFGLPPSRIVLAGSLPISQRNEVKLMQFQALKHLGEWVATFSPLVLFCFFLLSPS